MHDHDSRSRFAIVASADCRWVACPDRSGLDVGSPTASAAREPPRSDPHTRTIQEQTIPVVTIQQGPRSVELKRELVALITDAFVDAYKIPADTVQVWIQEVSPESWGSAGKLTDK
ncbi:tautomerase family protein [Kitasatospora sp. NPDC001175]|uniref:tautomerase family protein n=1 Tax=Kitasatospora sp. NPDC001175 TaxID=3157103 RepID=UPI003D018BDD